MQWNYMIFLLFIAGVTSQSEYVEQRQKPAAKEEFDITLSCCGFQTPALERKRRQTSIRSLQEDEFDEVSPHVHRRDIKKVMCPTPRVVGGEESDSHAWPWMVAIFRTKEKNVKHLCGASLISQKYVLTAAHCFEQADPRLNPSAFIVKVGSLSTKDGQEYAVENILVHPGYRKGQFYNDIALLRVRGKVALSEKIYPVCLPSSELDENDNDGANNMTVIGWGNTEDGGENSEKLLEAKLPKVPQRICAASYSRIRLRGIPRGITPDFICAGHQEGGKDACQGDSGGPLTKNAKGRWFQYGIVSFGYGCAKPGFPGVYTRISRYTRWLYENTDLKHKVDLR